MLYEYALEPRAIAADWDTCRYLSEKFGFDRGRLLALYPKKWLLLAIQSASDLPDKEKKTVVEKLVRLKRDCSIRSSRDYDSVLPDWLTNAVAQQAIDPFRAIIAMDNAGGQEFVLPANKLDETHPLFSVAHDCQVQRDVASLATAMSMMLKSASHVLFVDAYYDPFNSKYQNTLRACLKRVQSANPVAVCEVHHLDYPRCPAAEDIKREAHNVFLTVIPDGMKLAIYRWQEKNGGEDFHARYLLTDKGGIRVDAGFSAEGSHQTTDMSLMAFDVSQSRMRAFARDADVYELVEPVLEIASDGNVRYL